MRNKYQSQYNVNANIENIINSNEKVLWRGRPKKNAFILNKIVGMLPVVIIWLLFDVTFIVLFSLNAIEMDRMIIIFLVIFFAFHLLPVWIWLSRIIMSNREYKLTEYAITDKRVIIKSGFIAAGYTSLYFQEIKGVSVRVGLIDRLTKVGDILLTTTSQGNTNANSNILDIENPYDVYKIIEKATRDVTSDINFPNAYRPENNQNSK